MRKIITISREFGAGGGAIGKAVASVSALIVDLGVGRVLCVLLVEYDDEKLQATVAHERKVRGWGSERSYFLAALREECEKRHLDYCW